jgi:hypothetical protein
LVAAAERVEEQLETIREYFLEYIPENQPHLIKNGNYVTIKNFMQRPQLLSELSFVKSVANLFTMFTKKYQTSAHQHNLRVRNRFEKFQSSQPRIDHFWNKIDNETYSNLKLVTKAALIVGHRCIDLERGINKNGQCLVRSIRSGLKSYKNILKNVPFNQHLIQLARSACAT